MTGPDGADRVVWAIGGLFFCFYRVFLYSIYHLMSTQRNT